MIVLGLFVDALTSVQCFSKAWARDERTPAPSELRQKGKWERTCWGRGGGGGDTEAVTRRVPPLLCPWKVFYSLTRSAVYLANKGLVGQKMRKSLGFREAFVVESPPSSQTVSYSQ